MPFHTVVSSGYPKLHVVYFHTTGFEQAFGPGKGGANNGANYVRKILDDYRELFLPADFVLGALWGDNGIRVAEFHGYNELYDWSGNPTAMRPLVFRDLGYQPDAKGVGCGEMTIAFGREEENRRFKCKNAYEFAARRPELPYNLWQPNWPITKE